MDKFGCLIFIIFTLSFIKSEWQNDQEKWNIERVFSETENIETALIETQHKVRLLNDGSQWLTKALDVNKHHNFSLVSTNSDLTGNKNLFYQQSYKGYPVENTFFQIAAENGFIKSASGFHFPELDFRPIVSISEKFALQKIQNTEWLNVGFSGMRTSVIEPEGTLVITRNNKENGYSLCYRFVFENDLNRPSPVYVDAESGEIVASYEKSSIAYFEGLHALLNANKKGDFNADNPELKMDPTLTNLLCCMPERGLFANNTIVFSHEKTIWDEDEAIMAEHMPMQKTNFSKRKTTNAYLESDKIIGLGNNPFPSPDGEYVVTDRFASYANTHLEKEISEELFAYNNVNTEQFSKRFITTESYSGEGIFVILVKQEAGYSVKNTIRTNQLLA